jgi:hypothetical protein
MQMNIVMEKFDSQVYLAPIEEFPQKSTVFIAAYKLEGQLKCVGLKVSDNVFDRMILPILANYAKGYAFRYPTTHWV